MLKSGQCHLGHDCKRVTVAGGLRRFVVAVLTRLRFATQQDYGLYGHDVLSFRASKLFTEITERGSR